MDQSLISKGTGKKRETRLIFFSRQKSVRSNRVFSLSRNVKINLNPLKAKKMNCYRRLINIQVSSTCGVPLFSYLSKIFTQFYRTYHGMETWRNHCSQGRRHDMLVYQYRTQCKATGNEHFNKDIGFHSRDKNAFFLVFLLGS